MTDSMSAALNVNRYTLTESGISFGSRSGSDVERDRVNFNPLMCTTDIMLYGLHTTAGIRTHTHTDLNSGRHSEVILPVQPSLQDTATSVLSLNSCCAPSGPDTFSSR